MSTSTTYSVDYIVNVINGEALSQLNSMRIMMNKLGKSVQILDRLNQRLVKLNTTLHNKSWKVNLNTSDAERKLTALETQLERVRGKAAGMGFGTTGNGGRSGTSTSTSSSSQGYRATSSGIVKASGGKIVYTGRNGVRTQPSMPSQSTVAPTNFVSEPNLRSMGFPGKLPYFHSYGKSYGYSGRNPKQISSNRRVPQNTRGIPRHYWWTHVGEGNTVIDVPYRDVTNGGVGKYYPPVPYNGGGGNHGGGGNRGNNNNNTLPSQKGRGGGSVHRNPRPNNLGYKLFGPTPLTNNGGMAIDMLKGMGIAYGIAGIGQFFSNIINDSAEYDNTMQTVENILKSHDKLGNFDNRFTQMSNTIRQVGIQTKFKVTEVADAAKFLAMAGLGVEDINSAIKPISNIALVGDTELGETADLITNVMTAYNMQSHQMRKASDIMTNTFTMTNTTLPEIAEAYKYSASLLSAGGIGFEEATAAIGILGDAGIKGSQAGTTMRTILNNIINPRGKYRKQEWAKTKIKTTNDNGQVRSLAEIFTELAAQDLSVDQYYKLFDKTAAQGAVALAEHADKWNQVIQENFLSQGIAGELADKKKNTIQGLWSQLTSSITDDGVKAFKGIEGDIKNILRGITSWLQQSSTQELMANLFKQFMAFGETIQDVTEYFYNFYSMFGFAIRWLIKFQLYSWPVIKTITTLKTAFLGLMGITRLAAGVRALAAAFTGLSAAVGDKAAWSMLFSNLGGYIFSGGSKPLLPWTSGNVVANQNNVGYSTTTPNGTVAYYTQDGRPLVAAPTGGKPPRTGPRMGAGFSNFGRGVAAAGFTMAGAGLGYMAGNAFNDDKGGTWGSAIGGIIGAGVSSYALSGFAGAGSLLTNPIGWGILIAGALTAVGVHIFNRLKDINKANEATRKWKESFDNLHIASLDLTKDNGLLISYMRTYNNSLLSEQQQLEQSIDTFNRYWEAKKGPDAIKDEGAVAGTPAGKDFNSLLDIADWNTGKYSALEERFKAMGGTITSNSNGHTVWAIGDNTFASTNYASLNEEEATRVALGAFGASAAAPLENAEREMLKAVTSAQSAAYIQDRLKKVKDTYLPAITDEYSNNLSSEDVKNWSMSQLLQSKWVQATFRPRIESAIKNWEPFINAMTKFEAGTPLGAEAMQDALKPLLGGLFDRSQTGIVGSPQWYAKIQDIQTNYSRYGMTKEAADHYVSETFNQLVELYNKMDDKFKPMFGGFLDRSIWNRALSANESLASGGYYPGNAVGMKAKDSRGMEYTWSKVNAPYNLGMYGWVDKNGNQYFPDTRNGNLDLLSKNGNPFSGSDQYLSGLTFTPQSTSSYLPKTPGPWKDGYVAPDPSKYNTPNVSPTAYKHPTIIQTDKPVAQGNQLLATNAVGTQNINVYVQGATWDDIKGQMTAELPGLMVTTMTQALNTGTGFTGRV